MKKALFVGSFNPITKLHIDITLDLLKDNIVDYIYFLPVNSKKNNLQSISNRINMINLILKNNMKSLNILDYHESGLFNFNILEKINKKEKITHLIMGSDLFLKFNTFYKYEEILKKYNLIIIKRDGFDIENYILKYYNNYIDKFIIIKKEYLGSSTMALKNLNNKDNKYLYDEVLNYIKENNLYN